MSIQIRAWLGPWVEVSAEEARAFVRRFGGLSRDTMGECEARMANHLRGTTVAELYADHQEELPVWLQVRA